MSTSSWNVWKLCKGTVNLFVDDFIYIFIEVRLKLANHSSNWYCIIIRFLCHRLVFLKESITIFSFTVERTMSTTIWQLFSSTLRYSHYLALIFFSLHTSFSTCVFLWCVTAKQPCSFDVPNVASCECVNYNYVLQDDAIRNLFSAKTGREFSAQSLLSFLVSYELLCDYALIQAILFCIAT